MRRNGARGSIGCADCDGSIAVGPSYSDTAYIPTQRFTKNNKTKYNGEGLRTEPHDDIRVKTTRCHGHEHTTEHRQSVAKHGSNPPPTVHLKRHSVHRVGSRQSDRLRVTESTQKNRAQPPSAAHGVQHSAECARSTIPTLLGKRTICRRE